MTPNKHYCNVFEVVKNEGHTKILKCQCGREYRKFWNEDLQQMHLLNGDYINSVESEERRKRMTTIRDD